MLQTGRLPCENSRGGNVSTVLVYNINKLLVKAAVKSIFLLQDNFLETEVLMQTLVSPYLE